MQNTFNTTEISSISTLSKQRGRPLYPGTSQNYATESSMADAEERSLESNDNCNKVSDMNGSLNIIKKTMWILMIQLKKEFSLSLIMSLYCPLSHLNTQTQTTKNTHRLSLSVE